MAVKCDHFESGCLWKGTVHMLDDHTAKCQFALIPCLKKCRDSNKKVTQVLRKDMSEHLKNNCPNRPHKCPHCRMKGTYAGIIRHDTICLQKPLKCSNSSCPTTVERRYLKRHLEDECDFTTLPCKYQRIGCDVHMQRKDLGMHEREDSLHLHHALEAVVKLEKKLDDTVTCLRSTNTFTFMLTRYQWHWDNKEIFRSPSFFSNCNGYVQMNICISVNYESTATSNHMSLVLLCKDSSLPLKGSFTVILLNQLADENHHVVKSDFEATKDSPCENEVVLCKKIVKFIPHAQLALDLERKTQYLKDDTLYFQVSVQTSANKPWLKCN